jgi:cell wall-associated NlpC family hydrolase
VIEPPSIEKYSPDWFVHESLERLELAIAKVCIAVAKPLPGDLALFKFHLATSHATIVTDWPRFIHADRGADRVLEDLADEGGPMERRLTGFWSPKVWHRE